MRISSQSNSISKFLSSLPPRIRKIKCQIPFLDNVSILVFGLTIQICSWRGDFEGGDIAAARRSFLSDSPIDIWGGFSGLFYSSLPNQIFSWGFYLAVLHLTNTCVGLIFIRKIYLNGAGIKRQVFFFIISYFVLNFVTSLTRDSTMFSFILLGFGIWLKSHYMFSRSKKLLFQYSGYFLLIIGCAFRPWISIAVYFLLLSIGRNQNLKENKVTQVVLFLVISLVPLVVDNVSYLVSNLRHVHPELQVIAMDAGTLACYSNDANTRSMGLDLLNHFGSVQRDLSQICADFHPNTWQSVAYWNLSNRDRSGLGLLPLSDNKNKKLISISTEMSESKYREIRTLWIKGILGSPKGYLQVKASQFIQVVGAGDSFGFRIDQMNQNSTFLEVIKILILLPYDIAISLHLLAPLTTIILGVVFFLFFYRNERVKNLYRRLDFAMLFAFLMLWSAMTTVAFIGDNGRYVYASSLLFMIFLISYVSKDSSPIKKNSRFVGG